MRSTEQWRRDALRADAWDKTPRQTLHVTHMHEGSSFTYIMASRSHTLYIGVTTDLRKHIIRRKWKASALIRIDPGLLLSIDLPQETRAVIQ